MMKASPSSGTVWITWSTIATPNAAVGARPNVAAVLA
jgi:hypothetical protein